MEHLGTVERFVALAIGLGTLLGLVVGWARWVRPRWKSFVAELVAVRDTILGRPAINDSITGVERVPALPGMGMRQARTEEQVSEVRVQVSQLTQVVTNLAEVTRVQSDHETRISRLEQASAERTATKAESAAAWSAVAAVAAGASDPTADDSPAGPTPQQP